MVLAQDVTGAVFVSGDNNVIQLGNFVETTPGSVPVSIYYQPENSTFYYTWYNAEKDYHVLKAYDSKAYSTTEYIGVYYEKDYKPSY